MLLDLVYNLLAFGCICYSGWRVLHYAIELVRTRGQAIDEEEPDILLVHEADEYAALLDEEHEEDWKAWTADFTAWLAEQQRDVRKRAEKFRGAR